jgi:hypothetical protein
MCQSSVEAQPGKAIPSTAGLTRSPRYSGRGVQPAFVGLSVAEPVVLAAQMIKANLGKDASG